MALVDFDNSPKITDTVLFTLETKDAEGVLINPFKVDEVKIFFIERLYTVDKDKKIEETIEDTTSTSFFRDASPVDTFGNATCPAWLSTDTDAAFIEKKDFDDDGNPLIDIYLRVETVPARRRLFHLLDMDGNSWWNFFKHQFKLFLIGRYCGNY